MLPELSYELRSDEPASTNNHDFHNCYLPFIFLAEAFQAPVVLARTEHHIFVTPSCGYNFHTVTFLSSSGLAGC